MDEHASDAALAEDFANRLALKAAGMEAANAAVAVAGLHSLLARTIARYTDSDEAAARAAQDLGRNLPRKVVQMRQAVRDGTCFVLSDLSTEAPRH